MRDHVTLLFGLSDPSRDNGAADGTGRGVKQEAGWCHVVGKTVLNNVASAEPGRE